MRRHPLSCRLLGHAWSYTWTGPYDLTVACTRCGYCP